MRKRVPACKEVPGLLGHGPRTRQDRKLSEPQPSLLTCCPTGGGSGTRERAPHPAPGHPVRTSSPRDTRPEKTQQAAFHGRAGRGQLTATVLREPGQMGKPLSARHSPQSDGSPCDQGCPTEVWPAQGAHALCPFGACLQTSCTILRPSEIQTGFRARQGPSVRVFHWNKDFRAITQSGT